MLAHPAGWAVGAAETVFAWPLGSVHRGEDGQLIGYYAPRLSPSRFTCSLTLFDAAGRTRLLPGLTWAWLLRLGASLAEAVTLAHSRGHVIGDLAPANVYATAAAGACLIDCDGWQVRDPAGGSDYPCPMSRPEYTAPEITDGTHSRTPASDWWSLSVVIGQLLFLGFHPFGGLPVAPGWSSATIVEEVDNIRSRRLWLSGADMRVPPGTPARRLLPPRLRELFARALVDGHDSPTRRPKPHEWSAALMAARGELIVCPRQDRHVYPATAGDCPWCEVTAARSVDPFRDAKMFGSTR
jgi:DNA-binding helix-hairpin-helix protein with protein kinase domain